MADGQIPPDPFVQSPVQPSAVANDHAPSVPSPLNPDAAARPLIRTPKPIVREQREKKDSLKKRENAGTAPGRIETPDFKASAKTKTSSSANAPLRYQLSFPESGAWIPPRDAIFDEQGVMYAPDGQTELRKVSEHMENKKNFRYGHCIADPVFRHKQLYRSSENAPFNSRMSVEDSDRNIHFDSTFRIVGNDKGWRMSRANVFAREGSLYYEVKIMKGIPQDSTADAEPATSAHPHVRMGWARREAPLDAPVGFDGYSYGITDTRFDTMHRSRPGKFLPPSKSKPKSKKQQQQQPQQSSPDTPLEILRENDVIGLLITLPPLPLHRKVVAGTYNPAVDFSYAPDPNAPPPDIIRDRIPLIYRGAAYFEQNEYQPTRTMIQYSDRAPSNIVVDRPHPNHSESALRSLPGSSFVVYKNGIKAGTAFEGLLSFLPPASAPGNVQGARQGMDDGSLGYYPAVSVFSGGMAEVNLGPRFWCPPAELVLEGQDEPLQDVEMTDADGPGASAGAAPEIEDEYDLIMKPRAISARYFEQIAEDLVWDIVDEASFFALDGGYSNKKTDLLLTPGPDGVVPNE